MGEPVEVWFNPSCSKCRIAREQLDEAGVEYRLRRYLDDPPTEAELRTALAALGLAAVGHHPDVGAAGP